MNSTTERTYKRDEIVGLSTRPGRWQVVKVNKTTIEVKPLDGQSNRNLRTYPYMITAEAPPAPVPGQVGVPISTELPEFFEPGQIVTCSIPKLAGRLLVVTGDKGRDRVSCSPLFATGFEGWGIPRPTLTVVEPAEVADLLLFRASAAADDSERSAIRVVRDMLDRPEVAHAVKNANGSQR